MTALCNPRWTKSFDAAHDVNQLLDAFFSPQATKSARHWLAPVALWEDGDHFYAEVEMPGVKREDVELTLEKNVLRVVAERKAPEGERNWWHNERGYGRVERAITLADTIDGDSIEAELVDGVLHLKLRKRPETLARKIEIKA